MKWLDDLERKYRGVGITHLISYIVGAGAIIYLLAFVDRELVGRLVFDWGSILQGQVWRLVSFVFFPPDFGWFGLLALMLYYNIGSSLEREWGTFRFNFYFFCGVLGAIVSGIVIYYVFRYSMPVSNNYIYLSMFLAFARLYPDYTILVFMILPVKMKWLGYISWFFVVISLFTGPLAWVEVIFGLLNYFIFFGPDIVVGRKHARAAYKRKTEFRTQQRMHTNTSIHKCAVCGRTEKDDPDLEFRYCSKCNGEYEYCMDHLFSHEHKK